jgi:hypothetical protein
MIGIHRESPAIWAPPIFSPPMASAVPSAMPSSNTGKAQMTSMMRDNVESTHPRWILYGTVCVGIWRTRSEPARMRFARQYRRMAIVRLPGKYLLIPVTVAMAASVAVPASASADFPPGTYAVPNAMGYGKYVAQIEPGAAGCTFSTYSATVSPSTLSAVSSNPWPRPWGSRSRHFAPRAARPGNW